MAKSKIGEAALCWLSNSHYQNRFFESPPTAGFQKTDFVVFSAFGAENNKIGSIMRIAGFAYFIRN
jgi:hypothetical protein